MSRFSKSKPWKRAAQPGPEEVDPVDVEDIRPGVRLVWFRIRHADIDRATLMLTPGVTGLSITSTVKPGDWFNREQRADPMAFGVTYGGLEHEGARCALVVWYGPDNTTPMPPAFKLAVRMQALSALGEGAEA